MKIDKAVKRETTVILCGALILSALQQAVWLVIGKWDMTVLFSNLLIAGVMVLNFFLMGLTVQRALGMEAEEAKKLMKLSQSLRLLMVAAALVVGAALPAAFNFIALVPPIFFNRITITVHKLALAKKGGSDDEINNISGNGEEVKDTRE